MRVAQHPALPHINTAHPQRKRANTTMDQKRPRPHSFSIQIPRAQPLNAVLSDMSYNRQSSPGSRRINNPARASDSVANAYGGYERHNSYTSPRTSVSGVIPISSQTFVNAPPPAGMLNPRPPEPRDGRTEAYSGRSAGSYAERPRRSSLVDTQRGSNNVAASSGRSRPTVVQNDIARPSSPLKTSREKDYYVTPGATKDSQPRKVEHKKLYSVNEGTASLVADVNVPSGVERHHRRRDSDTGDRPAYKGASIDRDRERRGYHLNGPSRAPQYQQKSIEDDDAYSYTDAAGMFRETAPVWREQQRPRRGSMDRNGGSRERPVSIMDDPRRSNKDIGPPPSTRGWGKIPEKLNEGMGRATSMRERPRQAVAQSPTAVQVPQSPTRARVPQSPTRGRYPEARAYGDAYYVPPRTNSEDRFNQTLPQERPLERREQHEYDERKEPSRYERRNSVTRHDQSVERRGFGIRADSRDRYGRGSDENFDRQNRYRDSGYAGGEPHRRDTAPEINYQEERRLEQEKIDRRAAELEKRQLEATRELEQRRREDDRGYNREYDRERDQRRGRDHDTDRERERERERMMQPQHEHERHHHRHDSNRDRQVNKDNGSRASGETSSQPGLSSAAATGIAGVAAAYGLNKAFNRSDDRDKQRDYDRGDKHSPRSQAPEGHSDDSSNQHDRDRGRPAEQERGLGFAFEQPPEPPRSAPPMKNYPEPTQTRERVDERDYGRQPAEDKTPALAGATPSAALDPDEDYRRRMEQIQRELGHGPEDRNADSDPERERRRHNREQRFREREMRNGDTPSVLSNATYDSMASSRMPGAYENESYDSGQSATSRPRDLNRKPSVLDMPMTNEPVQIIDNSMSHSRENRVRIVDPPTEEEERKPKGILKKPTAKFPEHPDAMREGVAPLKDATKSGIPPGARWTKIDRRLVNPEALEEAKERFEERLDCVIVLRVLTKEEIQKLADRTREIRDERHDEEREERKAARRRDRNHDRRERDEYELEDSEDEFKPRAPRMLEAPSTAGASVSDFVRENKDRRREGERESQYANVGHSRRDEYS